MNNRTPQLIKINRFVWLFAGIIVIGWLIYIMRSTLLPFVLGGALAYIMSPMVSLLDERIPWMNGKRELKRVILIFIVMAAVFAVVAVALLVIIPDLIAQVSDFIAALPNLFQQARATLESLNDRVTSGIPEEFRQTIIDAEANLVSSLGEGLQGFAGQMLGWVTQTAGILIGLAILPMFLFYVLKDGSKIIDGMMDALSPGPRVHARNIVGILNGVFSSYVRAQLFLGVVVGVMVYIGLLIIGVPHAPTLAFVAGVFELVPIIGPWLGAIPGVLVVLAVDPEKLVWVILLYVGVQLLENSLLVPRIQSHALSIHPVMIMIVIVVGGNFFGIWGVVLGPPLAAAAKEVMQYFVNEWRSNDDAQQPDAAKQPADATAEPQPGEAATAAANAEAD